MEVKSIEWHRNGVAGNGFWVLLFTKDGRNYMATAFVEHDKKDKHDIAVLDTDLLAQGNIKFGENSWYYENFAPEILKAIKKQGVQ